MNSSCARTLLICLFALCLARLTVTAAVYEEVGGRVVIEGEHFHSKTNHPSNNHHWHIVPDDDNVDEFADSPTAPEGGFTNARGDKYLQMLPVSGFDVNTAARFEGPPWVDYKILIKTTGRYRLYLRWRGYDGNSDSLHAQIVELTDGPGGVYPDWYRTSGGSSVNFDGSWRAAGAIEDFTIALPSVNMEWTISNPGVYTIRIRHREDGVALDALSLQLTSIAAPTNPGPDESAISTSVPPFISSITPSSPSGVFPDTQVGAEIEDADKKADPNSVTLSVNGTVVTATVSKTGNVTKVSHTPANLFAAGSTNRVQLIYADTASPAGKYTNSWQFVVENYHTFTGTQAVPAGAVDTAASGFTARIAQARDTAGWPGADLPNTTKRAEDQLAGRLPDPLTGKPMVNFAVPGPGPGGSYIAEVINLNQEMNDGGNNTEIGNFQTSSDPAVPDVAIPGIPGTDPESAGNRDNIAGEFTAYLELKAGLHRFGVNSDDGFRVTTSPNPRDNTGPQLGVFAGGRGSADSLFSVLVDADGIYPVRLIWYEGGGGANVEFFTVNLATGKKTLINDRANGGIKAYAKASGAARPFVSVSPVPDSTGVIASVPIVAQIFDQASKAVAGSVRLKVNGTDVTPTVAREGNATVVTYDPPGLMASNSKQEVTLTYSDDGTPAATSTVAWSFTVQNWSSFPVIPANYAIPASSIDLTSSGFTLDVHQLGDGAGGVLARFGYANNNIVAAAEKQHARRFIDEEGGGQPWPNNLAPGPLPGGKYSADLINWNQTAPANAGTFNAGNGFEDILIPGVLEAGDTPLQNWIVIEAISYLELKAGVYRFNPRVDDGYKITTSPAPEDPNGILLGLRSPGGGVADAFFNVIVEQDGIYPIRFLWWEGTGGASAEWIMVDQESGAVMLVNDRTRAVSAKAYRVYKGPISVGTQPRDTIGVVGSTATFAAIANDPVRATYQWLKNGQPIAGATSDTFTTPVLTAADNGAKYSVQVKGPSNTDTSREATLAVISPPATPDVSFNFNDGQTPAGTEIFGSATLSAAGGVSGSGALEITAAANNQTGAWRIPALEGGAEVASFVAAFDLFIGNGTTRSGANAAARPADGASFNFAPDLPAGTYATAEEGAGTGITISFDTYDSGNAEAPAIDVKYKAAVVASTKMLIEEMNNERFVPVLVRLEPDGTVDVIYDGKLVHHNVQLPGYTPISAGYFGFAARTGGANEDHLVDNVRIDAAKSTGAVRITAQPQNAVVVPGKTATFAVTVSDPTAATYQWFKNNTAIAGATARTYTTPAATAADDGAKFHVEVTTPGGKVVSDQATLTVFVIEPPANPKARFDFNNNQAPAGTAVAGTTRVEDGAVKLTDAVNNQQGSFYIPALDPGDVSEFTVAFKVRIGGGTPTPADGMSFVWSPGLDPAGSPFGEQGTGTGIIVSFDTYNNAGGEAPAIDVFYAGTEVATTKLPITQLSTGDSFVDVIIRLQKDGTLDVVYNGNVIYNNLALPGFKAQSAAFFAFGARTGGLNDNHWIDDIAIATGAGTGPGTTPTLTVAKQGAQITITWSQGTLVSSPTVTGPYQPVANATSPYNVTPAGGSTFYKVLAP